MVRTESASESILYHRPVLAQHCFGQKVFGHQWVGMEDRWMKKRSQIEENSKEMMNWKVEDGGESESENSLTTAQKRCLVNWRARERTDFFSTARDSSDRKIKDPAKECSPIQHSISVGDLQEPHQDPFKSYFFHRKATMRRSARQVSAHMQVMSHDISNPLTPSMYIEYHASLIQSIIAKNSKFLPYLHSQTPSPTHPHLQTCPVAFQSPSP
jgi:hypothetical protein